jgi:hypothetical protein
MSLCDVIARPTFALTPRPPFDFETCANQFTCLDEPEPFPFTTDLSAPAFVSYLTVVIQACGNALNTRLGDELGTRPPTFASFKVERMSNSSVRIAVCAYFEPVGRWSPLVNRYTNGRAVVACDDHTGEVTPLARDAHQLNEVSFLPLLHPKNFGILPTEI